MLTIFLVILLLIIDLSISNIQPITNKARTLKFARNAYIASLIGISSTYIYVSISDDNRYERIHYDLFNKYINKDNLKILEIGFGNEDGNLKYYPNTLKNIKLIGCDPSINLAETNKITRIKKKYLEKNINLELNNQSAEYLKYPSEYFDIIVSTLVFCTIENPNLALEECYRVLKKNGLFISIDHILSDNDNNLAYQQQILNPLQQKLANGCNLNRRTDILFKSYIKSNNNNNNNNAIFDKILSLDYFTLNTQYPISRQIATVIQK